MTMPNGMSLPGSRVSSAAVETASNPMYEKKMMAAAALIPAKPFGANPPVPGLVQFDGLMRNAPTAMKNRMMPTLSSTIALLALADSLMPMTRMTVSNSTTATAGRLMMNGMLPKCGAMVQAAARYFIVSSDVAAPPAG